MRVASSSLLVALAAAWLAGCSTTPKEENRTGASAAGPAKSVSGSNVQPVAGARVQETETQRFGRLIKAVDGQSVYFDFDDFTIKTDYRQAIQAHAEVLKKTGRGSVSLEGNADQRGSREYNLALGQRRAEAVSAALKSLGVPAGSIEAISFGEERPRGACENETCWAQNRRVDFTYKLK